MFFNTELKKELSNSKKKIEFLEDQNLSLENKATALTQEVDVKFHHVVPFQKQYLETPLVKS